MYPQYDWLPWKFDVRPQNYWEDKNIRIKFVNWASQQLGIKEMKDWYKITNKVLKL
jgi:hypothetical protein